MQNSGLPDKKFQRSVIKMFTERTQTTKQNKKNDEQNENMYTRIEPMKENHKEILDLKNTVSSLTRELEGTTVV